MIAGDGDRDWQHKPGSQLPPIAESGYRCVQTANNCILVLFKMASGWWDQLRNIRVLASQARNSVDATIVRLPGMLATR